uniref:BZIP domain-containing protein n=1 Tax=Caenorhabditis tropicalis TaxID=1561998 RepID=A0A1I7U9E6_9PELO
MTHRVIKEEIVSDDEEYQPGASKNHQTLGPGLQTRGRRREEEQELRAVIELSKRQIKEEIPDDNDVAGPSSSTAQNHVNSIPSSEDTADILQVIIDFQEDSTEISNVSSSNQVTKKEKIKQEVPELSNDDPTVPCVAPPPQFKRKEKVKQEIPEVSNDAPPPQSTRRDKVKQEIPEIPDAEWREMRREKKRLRDLNRQMNSLREQERLIFEESQMRERGAIRSSARLQKKRDMMNDQKSDIRRQEIPKQPCGIQKPRRKRNEKIEVNRRVVKEEIDTYDQPPSHSEAQSNQQIVLQQEPTHYEPEADGNLGKEISLTPQPPTEEAVNVIEAVAGMQADLEEEERREKEMKSLENLTKTSEQSNSMIDYDFGLVSKDFSLVELDLSQHDFDAWQREEVTTQPIQSVNGSIGQKDIPNNLQSSIASHSIEPSNMSDSNRVNTEINRAISENQSMNTQELNQLFKEISAHNRRKTNHRLEEENGSFSPHLPFQKAMIPIAGVFPCVLAHKFIS